MHGGSGWCRCGTNVTVSETGSLSFTPLLAGDACRTRAVGSRIVDPASEEYVSAVASAMAQVFGSRLTSVYLHGSAVLGGFDARRSDVDVLVVVEGALSGSQQSSAATLLSETHLPCPALGLELSVVTEQAVRHPIADPPFELHVTTTPEGTRVVDGQRRGGDPDLVLHFAVARAAGRLIGPGQPASKVFAPVPKELIVAQMAVEVGWGLEYGPGEYAVLNACRSWRFLIDGAIVSKIDGALWALDRVGCTDRDLIQSALNRQRSVPAAALNQAMVRQFAQRVRLLLTSAQPQ